MVDPISDAERSTFNRRVRLGTTLLVGVSAGLVSLQVDPTLLQAAGAVVGGLVLGYLLGRYVVPSRPAPATRQRRERERENPFADGGDDDRETRSEEKRRQRDTNRR